MKPGLYRNNELIYTWERLIDLGLISTNNNILYECSEDMYGELVISDNIEIIDSYSFYYCQHLTDIKIPDSVCQIKTDAFQICTMLKEIKIPDSVKEIESGAFSNCQRIINITLPNSITTINKLLFYDCRKMKEFTIPNNIVKIGKSALCRCLNLNTVKLSKGLKKIDENIFAECNNLTKLIYPGTEEEFKQIDGWENIFNGNKLTIENVIFHKTLDDLINEGKSLREANMLLRKQKEDMIK